MKRLLLLAVFTSAVVTVSAQAPAQAGLSLDAAIASIDATIAADFAKDGVGGLSIGVVSGKQLIWSKHYGYADVEAKRVADNETTYSQVSALCPRDKVGRLIYSALRRAGRLPSAGRTEST